MALPRKRIAEEQIKGNETAGEEKEPPQKIHREGFNRSVCKSKEVLLEVWKWGPQHQKVFINFINWEECSWYNENYPSKLPWTYFWKESKADPSGKIPDGGTAIIGNIAPCVSYCPWRPYRGTKCGCGRQWHWWFWSYVGLG